MYRGDMTVNVKVHWSWLLSLWSLWFLTPTSASACSCKRDPDPGPASDAAAVVFEGIVEEVKEGPNGGRDVTFSVVRAFKGAPPEQLTIHTDATGHPCAIPFQPREGYLVFAQSQGEGLVVPPCSRTQPSAQAEDDMAALGPGSIPVDIPPPTGEDHAAQKGPTAMSSPAKATAPGRGGCASCNARVQEEAGEMAATWAWTAALALAWRVRRRTRKHRSARGSHDG